MMVREIEKYPVVPHLSDATIKLLTELCFLRSNPQETECLLMFSTTHSIKKAALLVQEAIQSRLVSRVFITGGYTFNSNKSESELFFENIDLAMFPGIEWYQENVSQDTLSNVRSALRVHDFSEYKKILFISKSHASRRQYLTLKKYVPQAALFPLVYNAEYPVMSEPLSRQNWHKNSEGRSKVWGEFERLALYGRRGDIFFDEISEKIIQIETIVQSSQ